VYYHAGVSNLAVGDYILPASETGHSRTAEFFAENDLDIDDGTYSRDYVYVTTDLNWAAARSGLDKGWVYEVEPEGTIEEDPDEDFMGMSFRCPRARIAARNIVPLRRQWELHELARQRLAGLRIAPDGSLYDNYRFLGGGR
jgi:hypothetical protein